MTRKPRVLDDRETASPEVELSVPLETVCFIVFRARQFDVKDAPTLSDDGSDPADEEEMSVLEDREDDPVLEELTSFISALSVDGQIDLVALMWLGRGDYTADDWDSARGLAADEHNEHTAEYLCGTPLLGDHLAEGLSLLGYSCV